MERLRVDGDAAVPPACNWSADQVGAWFAASRRWKQYKEHFAECDGPALFTFTHVTQLHARGVLPLHAAALLAELLALE